MSTDRAVKYGTGGAAAGFAVGGPIGAGVGGGLGALYGAFSSDPADSANANAAAIRQQAAGIVQQKQAQDAALRQRLLEQRMAMFKPVNAQIQKMYGVNMQMPDVSNYFTQPGGGGGGGQASAPPAPPPPTPGLGGWQHSGGGAGLGTAGSVGKTVTSMPTTLTSPISALLGSGSSGGVMDYVNKLKQQGNQPTTTKSITDALKGFFGK